MPLNNIAILAAKPLEKPYKLTDQKGLYLLVNKTGKYWRYDYRFAGKRKTLSLGVYPEVKLATAREKLDEARRLLSNDVDPAEDRKMRKVGLIARSANSFEAVAREWFEKFSKDWVSSHSAKIIRRLERDIFPWLGSRPIAEISPPELLSALRRIENRGAIETAHRALQNCGQIFRYAIATGRATRDISGDLRGAIPPSKVTHHAAITEPKAVGELLRAIETYQGTFITKSALRIVPYTFVRSSELRMAKWDEFNLDLAEWRIPAARMKVRELHIVPLSIQVISILRELHALTGNMAYVFPGARTNGRPMSENTINGALRRLGYEKDVMTGHGFRSTASTLLNEQHWNKDAIERQLSHGERNKIRAAYNYAEHLPMRREMMQAWADYLDGLRAGAEIITLHPKSA